VIGLQVSLSLFLVGLSLYILAGAAFVLYLAIKYTPVIRRIFQTQPPFLPLRLTAAESGETIDITVSDGLRLRGSFFRSRAREQAGMIVYCHEYLSDRWSYHPYVDRLRDLGFDVFAFDFRNHGASEHEPGYTPMQWTTDREVRDLRAVLAELRSLPDHDPAGFGLFGVSRGGTTALVAAAVEPDVWGVVTDGAFPTRGTMVTYIIRWAEIYVKSELLRRLVPTWVYVILANIARRQTERRLNCRFPNVEAAASRLGPRPWLMIHGQCDSYISPEIARGLYNYGRKFKELWLVPKARHNRCLETDPEGYSARVVSFLDRFAPRRPILTPTSSAPARDTVSGDFAIPLAAAELTREIASPISG
jgi:pimeloyl-ACP methyl ester carboxylesterase